MPNFFIESLEQDCGWTTLIHPYPFTSFHGPVDERDPVTRGSQPFSDAQVKTLAQLITSAPKSAPEVLSGDVFLTFLGQSADRKASHFNVIYIGTHPPTSRKKMMVRKTILRFGPPSSLSPASEMGFDYAFPNFR